MDQYTRVKKICNTNYGDVSIVSKNDNEQLFVMKRISLEQEQETGQNPLNEAKVLEMLDHPNIIKNFQTFIFNQKLCIVMEYADNGDLKDKVKEAKQQQQLIHEDIILEWFAQICLALHYLHDHKILHRDIKIQNIFNKKSGIIKLGDFGISKRLDNTHELAKTSLGTPFYLSPEVCSNASYNHKSDIWMLGTTLYEICTLEKPFSGDSFSVVFQKIMNEQPPPIPQDYSPWIAKLIAKMLNKDANKRPDIYQILKIPQIQEVFLRLKERKEYKDYEIPIMPSNPHFFSLSLTDPIEEQITEESIIISQRQQSQRTQSESTPKQAEQLSKSPNTQKKHSSNSIHYFLEQARKSTCTNQNSLAQQQQSNQTNQYLQQQQQIKKQNNLILESHEETFGNQKVESIQQEIIQSQQQQKELMQMISQQQNIKLQTQYLQQKSQFSQSFTPTTQINQNFTPTVIRHQSFTPNSQKFGYQGYPNPNQNFMQQQSFESFISSNELDRETNYLNNNKTNKAKSYYRPISIDTSALDSNYSQKKQTPGSQNSLKTESDINSSQDKNLPTIKVNPKTFNFADTIFNPNRAPHSPNRTILFSEFLKNKLGEEKFLKMKNLLENSSNPLKILDENIDLIAEIIGEENIYCIKFFKFLITNSVTPPSSHFRTKSMQLFDEGFKFQAHIQEQMQQDLIINNQQIIQQFTSVPKSELLKSQSMVSPHNKSTTPQNKVLLNAQKPPISSKSPMKLQNIQNIQANQIKLDTNYDQ